MTMTKYYYELDTIEPRLFKIMGKEYLMLFPLKKGGNHSIQKMDRGSRNALKTRYCQVPDMFPLLLGVRL